MSQTQTQPLAVRLHALTALHGRDLHLDRSFRKNIRSREVLDASFDGNKGVALKFSHMIQALVTLCTAEPGQTNFAVMMGWSTTTAHIFFNQNTGKSPSAVTEHIEAIWGVLRALRQAETGQSNSDSIFPRETTPKEEDLIKKLHTLSHNFVRQKVEQRAKKRSGCLAALVADQVGKTDSEKTTLRILSRICQLATDNNPQDFRIALDALYNLFPTANPQGIESLKNSAQALPKRK